MNDEFMAYGEGSLVSGLTLAVMEDIGHYLGNYSASQCMVRGLQMAPPDCHSHSAAASMLTPRGPRSSGASSRAASLSRRAAAPGETMGPSG